MACSPRSSSCRNCGDGAGNSADADTKVKLFGRNDGSARPRISRAATESTRRTITDPSVHRGDFDIFDTPGRFTDGEGRARHKMHANERRGASVNRASTRPHRRGWQQASEASPGRRGKRVHPSRQGDTQSPQRHQSFLGHVCYFISFVAFFSLACLLDSRNR